jgi:hypothetical protein
MQPATYDFDVITDAPAPKSHPPERAEPAPQADAEEERRRSAATLAQEQRPSVQAAE